jgi:hypothetical protein
MDPDPNPEGPKTYGSGTGSVSVLRLVGHECDGSVEDAGKKNANFVVGKQL